jgi:hypothetical protein
MWPSLAMPSVADGNTWTHVRAPGEDLGIPPKGRRRRPLYPSPTDTPTWCFIPVGAVGCLDGAEHE